MWIEDRARRRIFPRIAIAQLWSHLGLLSYASDAPRVLRRDRHDTGHHSGWSRCDPVSRAVLPLITQLVANVLLLVPAAAPPVQSTQDSGRRRSKHVKMKIEAVSASISEDWHRLRCALWPDHGVKEHRQEIAGFLSGSTTEPAAVFLALSDEGNFVGLIELSIRVYAEGCKQANPAYVEGIYVSPGQRRQGIARKLLCSAEDWARENGCGEIASDSLPDNTPSAELHTSTEFQDAGLIQCWIKPLK